jgi:Ca2+-transporting ATPase
MGHRGTDVAREASSLVLLDDDFSSIVQAVKQGRRIFDNLKKGMALHSCYSCTDCRDDLDTGAIHMAARASSGAYRLLHLIIDPACSIVFEAEPEEVDVMRRPPRNPKGPSLRQAHLVGEPASGARSIGDSRGLYGIALYRGQAESEARALAFTTLIIANLGLILINRSWSLTVCYGRFVRLTQRCGG